MNAPPDAHRADTEQPKMLMVQTADPEVYVDMLAAGSPANRAYCEKHGIEYFQFIGIKRGYFPWHATFNRILILEELLRDGYSGWVFYLDADAFVFDTNFDIRGYCRRSSGSMIAAPGGLSGEHWDINAGVFLINLGSADGRTIVRLWYDDFMRTSDAALQQAAMWGETILSDQRRLQLILRRNPDLATSALVHAPREFLNRHNASFVRQSFRSTGMTVDERTQWIEGQVQSVLGLAVCSPVSPLMQYGGRHGNAITGTDMRAAAPRGQIRPLSNRLDKISWFLAIEGLLSGGTNLLFDDIAELLACTDLAEDIASTEVPGDRNRSNKDRVRARLASRFLQKYALQVPKKATPISDGIAVYGTFRAETGLGQAARGLVEALRTAGVPVSAHNVPSARYSNRAPLELAPDLNSDYLALAVALSPSWLLQNFHGLPLRSVAGRRRIGYWPWELPVFPAACAKAFDLVHEVWVPSTFSARATAAATTLPVHVIPHPIKVPEIDRSEARVLCGLPEDDFIFLTAFDFNSYPARKNPVAALRAFLDAFPEPGPSSPRFILKCHGRRNRGTVLGQLMRLADDLRVTVIDEAYSRERMGLLQAACDCFVSLHRSEGFGLNIAECMGMGKPCIATGFSGNLDFMNEQNSILVPYRMRQVQQGEYIHGAGQWWADPVHEAAVAAFRAVAAGGLTIKALALNAEADIARDFSPEAIGRIAEAVWRGRRQPFSG